MAGPDGTRGPQRYSELFSWNQAHAFQS